LSTLQRDHTLNEAKIRNQKTVPCIIREGSLKEAMMKNIFWNELRGRNKPSDEIRAINHLINDEGVTLDEIISKTPKRKRHFEELFRISEASPLILEALDQDTVKLGHAVQLSRLPNWPLQEKNLQLVKMYDIKVKDIKQHVNSVLEILAQHEQETPPTIQTTAPKVNTIPCHFCEEQVTLDKIRGFNTCMRCYYIALDAIKAAKDKPTEREILIKQGLEL